MANKVVVYWIVFAIYYIPILIGICLGAISLVGLLLLFSIPLLILSMIRFGEYRALITYLEEHHPEEWGVLAGDWLRHRLGSVQFSFSDELDEDPVLRSKKRNYKHLNLVMFCVGGILIIFALYLPGHTVG